MNGLDSSETVRLRNDITRQVLRQLSSSHDVSQANKATFNRTTVSYGQPRITIELPEGTTTPDLEKLGTIQVIRQNDAATDRGSLIGVDKTDQRTDVGAIGQSTINFQDKM